MKNKYFEINEDGKSVKCKIYFNDLSNINDVIISCHGYGGNKENSATKKLAQQVCGNGTAVVIFDWPCHGKDVKQKLNLNDCNDYLSLVIKYVKETLGVTNISANATSFGGYLTLKYVYENGNPFDKIILRCPAVIMHDVLLYNILTESDREELSKGKNVISGFERKMVISKSFVDSLASNDITKYDYSSLAGNTLIMHGTNDELIPIEYVKNFSDQNGIDFIPIQGADHMFKDQSKIHEAIVWSTEFLTYDDKNTMNM